MVEFKVCQRELLGTFLFNISITEEEEFWGFTKTPESWAACLFKLLLASVKGRKVFGRNKRVNYWLSWNENEWTGIPKGN